MLTDDDPLATPPWRLTNLLVKIEHYKRQMEGLGKTRLAMMCQKQKGLAMNSENLGKIYVIENKIVSQFPGGQGRGKRGRKMRLIFLKLLKTNVEKMSIFRLSTIFMKTNELNHSCHHIDENKGVRKESGVRS
jgi:hypothetical protein